MFILSYKYGSMRHFKALCVMGWVTVLLIMGGCVATSQTSQGDSVNLVMAENSQMKKRLTLIERENDVLEQENLQYKARVQKLAATVEKLNADLTALNEKYERDIALSEDRIQSLQEKFDRLEFESAQTIATLNSAYEALQEKRNRELKSLNEKIALQQTGFNQERDELKQQYATLELTLNSEISKLKSALKVGEEQINALKASNYEFSQKIEEITKQLEQAQLRLEEARKGPTPEDAPQGQLPESPKKEALP